MPTTLTFKQLIRGLTNYAGDINKTLNGHEMLLFGGIVRRGWTRSNADIGFEPEVSSSQKKEVLHIIRRAIEDVAPEAPTIVDVVDWDFARTKTPVISFQKEIYRYKDNYWKIEIIRRMKVEMMRDVPLSIKREEKIERGVEEVVRTCEGIKNENEILDCISGEVHDVRREVM